MHLSFKVSPIRPTCSDGEVQRYPTGLKTGVPKIKKMNILILKILVNISVEKNTRTLS